MQRNIFSKKLKGNHRLMKKSLILILLLNFSFAQLLDKSEKELIPMKRLDNIATKQMNDSVISPTIFLNVGKSKFV